MSTRRLVVQLSKFGNASSRRAFSTQIGLAARNSTKRTVSVASALLASGVLASLYLQREKFSVHAEANLDKEAVATQVQPTVVSGTHPQGAFVTIRLAKNADLKDVAKAAAKLQIIVDEISPGPTTGLLPPLMAGVGFSADVWRKVQKTSLPKDLKDFEARHGAYGDMPKSGGDIFLHVKAETQSLCYEVVKAFVDSMPLNSVDKVEDWYGFQYQDGRDLSGFIDGTENPAELCDRVDAAVISAKQDPDHVNGSYVIYQRWLHNLKPFNGLGIDAQEAVVGRTKPDSVELSGDLSLATSHVSRMRVDRHKVPIVRQSMPFGTVGGDHGLLFLAYSNTPEKFDILLDRMAGSSKDRDGAHNDAIMTFSRCIESQYFYIPSSKELSTYL